MTQSIADILAMAVPLQDTFFVCMRGDLVAQWERLERQLSELASVPDVSSLGDVPPGVEIRDAMDALRTPMAAATVGYELHAIGSQAWSDVYAHHPDPAKLTEGGEPDEAAADVFRRNWHAWLCVVVAACCVDPVMTPDEADALSSKLSDRQWNDLADRAWELNTNRQKVPFTGAVSAPRKVTSES